MDARFVTILPLPEDAEEEVKEWCSYAINLFPTRPESKQTQVFREEERLNILEEKVNGGRDSI